MSMSTVLDSGTVTYPTSLGALELINPYHGLRDQNLLYAWKHCLEDT